jgi:hypothetical protein
MIVSNSTDNHSDSQKKPPASWKQPFSGFFLVDPAKVVETEALMIKLAAI